MIRCKYHYNYLIFLLFLLCGSIEVYGQYDTINKHVIIAFDNALPKEYAKSLKDKPLIKSKIARAICDLRLKEGDYYSMVNFGISKYDSNIKKLARPIKDNHGTPIVWREFVNTYDMFSQNSWYDMIERQGLSLLQEQGGPFSLLTGAKSYVINSVCLPDERVAANKTYLVMVTDNYYNGNDDQNKEFDKMTGTSMNKKDFLEQCYNVAANLSFRYIKDNTIMINDCLKDAAFQVYVYEVVPAILVSLNSIVDYPANMGIERVNGGYRMRFDFKSASDKHILKRLMLNVIGKNNKSFRSYQFDGDGRADIMLPISHFEDCVKIEMSAWLLQKDNVYNGALLSPHDSNFTRLNVSLSHKLKNEVYFFGLVPIPDWMWAFTNNWHTAVIVWDLIALLTVIAIMCFFMHWLIRINTTYQPNNNMIKIKRIK